MKAQAICFGAGTIVNAIATGKGAAFGLALRATATAETRPEGFGVRVHVPASIDPALAQSSATRVLRRSRRKAGLEVSVDSEIPASRGLKSSSAVANAVVLAGARALGLDLEAHQIIRMDWGRCCPRCGRHDHGRVRRRVRLDVRGRRIDE